MTESKTCTRCSKVKPLDDFPRNANRADGRGSHCNSCRAEALREKRAGVSPEELAEQARRQRAGLRKDTCAVCGAGIDGYGICSRCQGAVNVLGGLDALKRAARAVRYLEGSES